MRGKYEHKCSFCGRTDHYYAKGLCAACYNRLRKNGTLEKQYPHGVGSRPERWSENTKKILEMHKSGMRQVDIVKEIGLTKQAVSLVIKNYAKPTNADRIRAMTDEELAGFMAHYDSITEVGEQLVYESWLDWLRQEAIE